MALVFMVIVFLIDYRVISQYAYILYGISLLLLVVVALYGYTTHGSQRWISIGGFSIQPSELVKLTIILALSRYFNDHRAHGGYSIRELIPPFFIVILPFLFILRQPDLGTALMLMLPVLLSGSFCRHSLEGFPADRRCCAGYDARCLAFPEAVSERPYSDLLQSRTRPSRNGLSHYPIHDSHRLRRNFRKRIRKRDADTTEIFAGTANGFRILCLRRRMGFYRRGYPDCPVPGSHLLWGLKIAQHSRDFIGEH